MLRRTSAAVLALPLALVLGGVASAAWTSPGSGAGRGAARSLVAPTSPAAATVAPTSSAIDIAFTLAANPPGTTYTVTRNKTKAGALGATVACSGLTASPCHDTGLTPSTTYTYTVSAVLGTWAAAAATTPSATTTAAFAITSHAQSGNKVTFSGTGSSGSTTISVVVCSVNAFPCASPVATVTRTAPSAGTWGPTAQTPSLSNGTTYYAQATQGSSVSTAYTFTT